MLKTRKIPLFILILSILFLLPHSTASASFKNQQRVEHRMYRIQQKLYSLDSDQQKRKVRLERRLSEVQTRYAHRLSQSKPFCQYHRLSEQQCIDAWLTRNNLNEFGDPKGSMYAGGTPLFNEATGSYIDRYQYIKTRHPHAPWWQMR